MALTVIHLVVICALFLLGVMFKNGRGQWLIAGYNTDKEKEKYDEKALTNFMGTFMFVLAACWSPMLLGSLWENMTFLWIGLGLFLAAVIIGVIYMNTGNRFKK